jgi:hypothetical protein
VHRTLVEEVFWRTYHRAAAAESRDPFTSEERALRRVRDAFEL